MNRLITCILLVALACTTACNGLSTAADPVDENDPRWHSVVRDIADHYTTWMRLDDALRWAPTLCSIPVVTGRVSEASPATPHGRKLYTLYVKDAVAYGAKPTASLWTDEANPSSGLVALEQVIVKQAWTPRELEVEGPPAQPSPFDKPVAPTDEGWVYAAVSADGTIRGAGRMASCMECHEKRADRLFGVPSGG